MGRIAKPCLRKGRWTSRINGVEYVLGRPDGSKDRGYKAAREALKRIQAEQLLSEQAEHPPPVALTVQTAAEQFLVWLSS
jgi:hypothetical protein